MESIVLRFPKAVTHFSPGSHQHRPFQATTIPNVFMAGARAARRCARHAMSAAAVRPWGTGQSPGRWIHSCRPPPPALSLTHACLHARSCWCRCPCARRGRAEPLPAVPAPCAAPSLAGLLPRAPLAPPNNNNTRHHLRGPCAWRPPTRRGHAMRAHAGDWVKGVAHGANGLSQERAYVTGLTAANLVVSRLGVGRPAEVLEVEPDEPHIAAGRQAVRQARELASSLGFKSPFL